MKTRLSRNENGSWDYNLFTNCYSGVINSRLRCGYGLGRTDHLSHVELVQEGGAKNTVWPLPTQTRTRAPGGSQRAIRRHALQRALSDYGFLGRSGLWLVQPLIQIRLRQAFNLDLFQPRLAPTGNFHLSLGKL